MPLHPVLDPIHPPATVEDLCDATGLGHTTVREGIRLGILPGRFVGRKCVICWEEFDEFRHGRWVPQQVLVGAMATEALRSMQPAIEQAVREMVARYMEGAAA